MRTTASRPAVSAAALILASGALTGCAASVEAGSATTVCSPSFEPGNEYGRLSVQQQSPGSSIQWGFYPNVPVSSYVVDVYMGSRRVDRKVQTYAPHGSVNAVDVRKGSTFLLTGEATNPKGDILSFALRCLA